MKLPHRIGVLIGLLLIALGTGTPMGCSSAWWTSFRENPAAQTQSFVQSIQTFLQMSQVVWAGLRPILPVDVVADIDAKYRGLVLVVTRKLVTLVDALHYASVARDTQFSALPGLIQGVTESCEQVQGLLEKQRFSSAYKVSPEQSERLQDLAHALQVARSIGGKP